MLPTLQIGPVALPVPALLILAGLWVALSLSERAASRAGVDPNVFFRLVLFSLGAGIIAARLSYVIQYPSAFASSPVSLISINPSLLDASAGAVAAVLTGLIFALRKAIPLWTLLDVLTPGLAVMGVATGLSHVASGAAFGEPTQLPWGLRLWGERRHPTQVYETLLAALVLAAVMFLQSRASMRAPGSLFLVFVALSAAGRIFLEGFRGDSSLISGGLRSAQLVAWAVLAGSLWALGRKLYRPPPMEPDSGGEG